MARCSIPFACERFLQTIKAFICMNSEVKIAERVVRLQKKNLRKLKYDFIQIEVHILLGYIIWS